jgi:hypothetical protein
VYFDYLVNILVAELDGNQPVVFTTSIPALPLNAMQKRLNSKTNSIVSTNALFMDRFRGMHDCLLPITAWLGSIFDSIRKFGEHANRVRAMDVRNVLLLVPLLLHNLLEEEFV